MFYHLKQLISDSTLKFCIMRVFGKRLYPHAILVSTKVLMSAVIRKKTAQHKSTESHVPQRLSDHPSWMSCAQDDPVQMALIYWGIGQQH